MLRRPAPALLLALLLAPLLAGCLDLGPRAARFALPSEWIETSFRPPVEIGLCGRPTSVCFEPSVAVDGAGRILVVSGTGGAMAVSEDDGATFQPIPPPPVLGAPRVEADALLQTSPGGCVWYSAMASSGPWAPLPPEVPVRPPLHMDSARVAATCDGGRTWPTNVVVNLSARIDRQWLAFSRDTPFFGSPRTTILLTYVEVGAGLRAVASEDGGRTFGEPATIAPGVAIAGPGLGLGGTSFAVPYHEYDASAGERGVRVAWTDDAGRTWRTERVAPEPGDFFPVLASHGGALHLAWRDLGKVLRVASYDLRERAWGEPAAWSLPGEVVSDSPWLVATPHRLAVAYFTLDDPATNATSLRFAGLVGGRLARATVATGIPEHFESEHANTDFAHAAFASEGRAVLVWGDGRETARVVVER